MGMQIKTILKNQHFFVHTKRKNNFNAFSSLRRGILIGIKYSATLRNDLPPTKFQDEILIFYSKNKFLAMKNYILGFKYSFSLSRAQKGDYPFSTSHLQRARS